MKHTFKLFVWWLFFCAISSTTYGQSKTQHHFYSDRTIKPPLFWARTETQTSKLPTLIAWRKKVYGFDRAYAVNGLCSPTRATLMTGLIPSQHGVHSWLNDHFLEQWPRDWVAVQEFRTLPLTLKNRGYHTAMIGKWHLGQPWEPAIGFQNLGPPSP